jgi:TonB family protein
MRMVTRRRQANDSSNARVRLRERWSEYVVVSTLAASVIHALIFIVWPKWNPTPLSFIRPTVELMQIDPIISYGSPSEPGEGEVAALPTREEVELVLEEAGEGIDRERGDMNDVLGAVRPSIVLPVQPEARSGNTTPPLPPLILEQLDAISPQLAAAPITVAWPLIRNPTVLRRFLRTRYNPWFGVPGATGSVSVAMWINERGSVEWAAVQQSSGSDVLDEIALAAFNDVVAFAPARNEGAPIPVSVVISVPFNAPW